MTAAEDSNLPTPTKELREQWAAEVPDNLSPRNAYLLARERSFTEMQGQIEELEKLLREVNGGELYMYGLNGDTEVVAIKMTKDTYNRITQSLSGTKTEKI